MSIIFSMIAHENLPNDTVELKGLVYQLLDVVEQQKLLIANQNERIEAQFLRIEEQSQQLQAQAQQLTTQSQKIEEQAQQIDQLTHQVNSLKRHRYGKRSEKTQEDDSKQNDSNNLPSSPDAHKDFTATHDTVAKPALESDFAATHTVNTHMGTFGVNKDSVVAKHPDSSESCSAYLPCGG